MPKDETANSRGAKAEASWRSTCAASGTSASRSAEMPVRAFMPARSVASIHLTVAATSSGDMRYSCSTRIG